MTCIRIPWNSVATGVIVLALLSGCGHRTESSRVVVYTALDQLFSEAILDAFEAESGIKVAAVYDTEATKTVGLVNRIIAESAHPRCDVFWNNEVVRSVMLKRMGLLAPYASPSAADIPKHFKDPDHYWTGFAARARVLICNTNLLSEADRPHSIMELTTKRWRGKVALAYPLFGTTATHVAALFATLGPEAATAYFTALQNNEVVIVDGNASSKDAVARGELPLAFTDTDDANVALKDGKPVAICFPDQRDDQMGTLVIPNTVALIHNAPHPEAARRLIDFILRRETERLLAGSGSAQMPVRESVPVPDGGLSLAGIKAMAVNWSAVEQHVIPATERMEALFIR
jgi:iron(III) transport system substrate-binding protein